MDGTTASADVVYAGFWRRAGAFVLDSLILGFGFYAVIAIIFVAMMFTGAATDFDANNPPVWVMGAYLAVVVLYYLVAAMYYSLQESSVHQASVGKRALGIKVTDAEGRRLTRGKALARWFSATLSYLTLYIGFVMSAFTQRKQALHDVVASTLVVDRWAYTEHTARQQRHVGALAVILSLVLVAVPVLGILAAIAIPAYQDYLHRAKVFEAFTQVQTLQAAVESFRDSNAQCPKNGDTGIGPSASYAGKYIAGIEAGSFDSGNCGLQAKFAESAGPLLSGKSLWLELGEDGNWTCGGDIKPIHLPIQCR